MSWVQINGHEKCKLLQAENKLFTVPDPWQVECRPELLEEDMTYYRREDNKPYVLISKGWNDKGLWETTYYKWEEKDEEEDGNLQ
ncbi:hypothetical protein VP501E541_P0092 [Vibrio phage 501E54-1]|nr:hypothetical protein VP501E541_P0092 [Vibrio phage 501E54-1]